MPRGFKHDTETLERIGRASRRMWARRKAAGKVALADVRRLEETNTCAPSVRPFLSVARDAYLDLLEDQGGADHVSAARKKLLDSEARLHLVELVLGMRIAQEPTDLDAMARLTAIVNARRALLSTLGLERRAREIELELSEASLEAAAAAAGRSVDELRGSAPASINDRPAGSDSERRSTP